MTDRYSLEKCFQVRAELADEAQSAYLTACLHVVQDPGQVFCGHCFPRGCPCRMLSLPHHSTALESAHDLNPERLCSRGNGLGFIYEILTTENSVTVSNYW